MATRGRFIVVEGIDGSGSTTQAQRLTQRLGRFGITAVQTHEPTSGPVGRLLRQLLRGDEVLPTRHLGDGQASPDASAWQVMALLFAADRMDHNLGLIAPALAEGTWVVSDRYVLSSLAYQAVTSGQGRQSLPWLRELNRQALVPDLTLVLGVPAKVAEARRRGRAQAQELFETDVLQSQLADWYEDAASLLGPDHALVPIDGELGLDDCEAQIWARIAPLLPS